MTNIQNGTSDKAPGGFLTFLRKQRDNWLSVRLFSRLSRFILFATIATIAYWLFIASDRYVSEASVIIRKTDSLATPAFDVSMLIAGIPGVNRGDQLLLREYLLSVDMLKKLDAQLNLKAHYSSAEHDLFSRLWLTDMEWFHRYYLSRVAIDYDDYAGVLRIKAQAYDDKTAQAIANMLVSEGERYMNQLSHELAQTQVDFLTTQVDLAQIRFQQASQRLLAFQNQKGLLSPQATAESLNVVIAKLEAQRAQVQIQLAALPKNLDRDHPNIVMLRQSLAAIDRQIAEEKAKLANPSGKTLNLIMEEFQRLQMEVTFTQELYKAALTALEKGRMDATRMLEKVSVLQAPTLPEYPMEPRRIYNSVVTLLFGLMLVGILKLLESIVLDHVD
jgi:capsular polysaccharide transport system permease protein